MGSGVNADDGDYAHDDDGLDGQKRGRLQVKPPPLQADHVIKMEKQLLAVSIGHFDNGEECKFVMNNVKKEGYMTKLGESVAAICSSIPRGGVLVFFPSKAMIAKCVYGWKRDGVWDSLKKTRSGISREVIVEPTGGNKEFEECKQQYVEAVDSGGAVLLAVFRGKMSEGVSFNDDYARAVICIGFPLPR
mgnify:FL=1